MMSGATQNWHPSRRYGWSGAGLRRAELLETRKSTFSAPLITLLRAIDGCRVTKKAIAWPEALAGGVTTQNGQCANASPVH